MLWNCRSRPSTLERPVSTPARPVSTLGPKVSHTPFRVLHGLVSVVHMAASRLGSCAIVSNNRSMLQSADERPISAGGHHRPVDYIGFGSAIRAARVKLGLRQRDLASAAGVSDGSVSRVERGQISTLSLSVIRAIAQVLEVAIELLPRSRSASFERTASATHSALAEAVIAFLSTFDGWVIRPEVGFSFFGDRGVIDLLAWHPLTRSLLVIELKTELVDLGAILGTLDRYVRNAIHIAFPLSWEPIVVSRLLLVGESRYARTRVKLHEGLFAAALPARGAAVRAWLRAPSGELRGLMFVTDRHPRSTRQRLATIRRVRRPRSVCP